MKKLSLFVFVDAFGYEIAKDIDFLPDLLPHKKSLRTVFGFSSACVPSILSGRMPVEHGHWNFFFYSPETSPFRRYRYFKLLPRFIRERGRFRYYLSKWMKKRLNFSGYFQVYHIPFKYLHLFDTCEKRDLFKPGGLNVGANIADYLVEKKVPYHLADWATPEEQRIAELRETIRRGEVAFAFMYTGDLDALLHFHSHRSDIVQNKIDWYRRIVRDVYDDAKKIYDEVDICVFSDHGMAEIKATCDVSGDIEKLGLKFGEDYVAMYDSTVARFWFLNENARQKITAAVARIRCGRILSDGELEEMGCLFPDRQFGELMFLLDAGVLMLPSYMGNKPLFGMHGYHPDDKDSYASFMSSRRWSQEPERITDIYWLMRQSADEYLASK
jgi:predicted AlkP superfamily pyrophosphatase or phosphodiesterase